MGHKKSHHSKKHHGEEKKGEDLEEHHGEGKGEDPKKPRVEEKKGEDLEEHHGEGKGEDPKKPRVEEKKGEDLEEHHGEGKGEDLEEHHGEGKGEAPKNVFQRFGDYLDSNQGKKRTKILVAIFFVLDMVMFYLYNIEIKKREQHIKAVTSILQFAVTYDPSLHGKSDLEILASVHLHTLHLLNWTLKNEELERELDILTHIVPGWESFENNLYFFSTKRKNWSDARQDCMTRHTADLVSCNHTNEQIYIDEKSIKHQEDYWIGLYKNSSVNNSLLWTAGYHAATLHWNLFEPNGGNRELCISIHYSGKVKNLWHDDPCNVKRAFICKMSPKSVWF